MSQTDILGLIPLCGHNPTVPDDGPHCRPSGEPADLGYIWDTATKCKDDRFEVRIDQIPWLKGLFPDWMKLRLQGQLRKCEVCCPAGTLHAGRCRTTSAMTVGAAIEVRGVTTPIGVGFTAAFSVTGAFGTTYDGCNDTTSGGGCIDIRLCAGIAAGVSTPVPVKVPSTQVTVPFTAQLIGEACFIWRFCKKADGPWTFQTCSSVRVHSRIEVFAAIRWTRTWKEGIWCDEEVVLESIGG